MTRPARHATAFVAVWMTLLGISVAVAGARREPPARLMVSADEHSLMLSRQSIVSGPALIQFLNRGEDPHDLRLRRLSAPGVSVRRTLSVAETPSGELAELDVKLPSGRYKLWCSLPGHEALGMRAKLRVKRRARS